MKERSSGIAKAHPLDLAVALLSRRSKLFSRGWGDNATLAEFSQRARYLQAPTPITIEWHSQCQRGTENCRDGKFGTREAMLSIGPRSFACPLHPAPGALVPSSSS